MHEIYGGSLHKMDFMNRRWCKVNDLGGRVFLMSLFYLLRRVVL
jgi:hypothetical protein